MESEVRMDWTLTDVEFRGVMMNPRLSVREAINEFVKQAVDATRADGERKVDEVHLEYGKALGVIEKQVADAIGVAKNEIARNDRRELRIAELEGQIAQIRWQVGRAAEEVIDLATYLDRL